MSGETTTNSPVNLQRRTESIGSPSSLNQRQNSSRVHSTHARPNTNTSGSVRISSSGERHTLPEIPRNPLAATVAHVVSRELGENFLKAPIRPETVKKLVISGNVDDISHRVYVQHLREIQAKREYQLQKIGNDEQTFLLAEIQAHESQQTDQNVLLSSLYVDEQNLTKDQVILPRDFLSFNLQQQIKINEKEEVKSTEGDDFPTVEIQEKDRLPKLTNIPKHRTPKTLWKEEMTVPDRNATRAHLKLMDDMTNFPINPRFDEGRQNQLITIIKPPAILPVFEAIPSEVVFTRYRVGDVHETTLQLRNLSSVAHSCRVIPPKTPYFCVSLSQYPSGHSLVATGLSVIYNVKFAPDTLGVYQDEIIVQCSNGTEFPVRLLAKRPPPLLTLPSVVDCGYWLAGGRKMCEFKVRNDGGEGRFAIVPASAWPAINFKMVARAETVPIPPFELAPATIELRPGDTFSLQVSFAPQMPGEFLEEFIMICDNGEISRFKLKGVAQTIQVRLEDMEGGVTDLASLEIRDISAQYSTSFITINPFSFCQKKMTIKNLTNVELPFFWATLNPVLYSRDDFAKQTQPVEIERVVCESSPFHVDPNRGSFPPLTTVEFRLIFAPSQIGNFHTVFHLIVPSAPVYPTPSLSPTLMINSANSNNDRIHSPEALPRSAPKPQTAPSAALRTTDYTVLRFETRGICENFKYIFDPFTIIFMDKLHKSLAYRKDFQLSNTSISPLIITWLSVVGDDIIHVEPAMAEIPSDSTGQFTLIFTGTKIGQSKIEIPFKLEGVDECGYFHVEAEIIGPEVEVEPATLDFGLIEFGDTVEQMIDIKNSSPIVAKCRLEEINQEHSDSVLFLPDNREIFLKPIEIFRIPIRLSAKEEGLYHSHLQLIVEDGKVIPLEVTALIQRPSAYLSSVELDLGESFLDVPIVRQIELHTVNNLPTHFQWGEPICEEPNQCLVRMEPQSGTLYHGKPFPLRVTFIPKRHGPLSDDWHIPCYIHNASQPIFFKLKSEMRGMNVEFRIEENVYQFDEEFQLDFQKVQLGEKSRLELIINNLTDINSDIKAKVLNFKTRSLPSGHGQKSNNFEIANQEIGVGFHLEQADSDTYLLPARGTATIPLTVISSMWGFYNDILQIKVDGIDNIREIPIRVEIIGNPIKTYLSANPNSKKSSLPVIQFGSMLHNASETVKKVHMQNISHVPVRIDWIVYDLEEEPSEHPPLIELISVIDNNPFDSFQSEVLISDSSEDLVSETTESTQSDFQSESAVSSRTSSVSNQRKPTPLVRLFATPYRGKRASNTKPIFTASSLQKVIKPREHFYLDITINPKNCLIKNRPLKCNGRVVGVLSVAEEHQGCEGKGFRRPIFYEHNEQIEFEVHSSLEMPSLRVELDDDGCDDDQVNGLCFSIPVGDVLSSRANIFDCTFPLTKTSAKSSAKSSSESSSSRSKVYERTLNLLNTRQSSIPFDLSISDTTFLSVEPSTTTVLNPQSKSQVRCQLHLTQKLIDRFQSNSTRPETVRETITAEHGRRIQFHENLTVRFEKNQTEQIVPIDIRLYYPILTVSSDRIDFGTCFLEQTRQKEFILKNASCSSSSWSIRKVNGNIPEAYEAFRIDPKSGFLTAKIHSKEKLVQQVISVYFTARHNQFYQCTLMIEGVLGEPPVEVTLTGEGSYDGKYEAVLDV